MTMTETRPRAAESLAPVTSAWGGGGWLATADHKRMGLLFLYGGLVAVVAGLVLTALFPTQGFGDGVDIWSGARSRLASANVVALMVIGLPAIWLGLATYLVPLQIGATRLALPRLHLASLWTFATGAVIVAIGYATGRPAGFGLGASAPPSAARGRSAAAPTELVITGLSLVALATMLAAVSILVTILVQRAQGVSFFRLPLFTWSVFAFTSVLVLSTPVFLSGLALLYVDQHYGGTLFAAPSRGGLKIWQHNLWLFGRPEALLLAVPALGAVSELVATAARRPLAGFAVARTAVVAAGVMTLLSWAAGASTLRSPFVPTPTGPTAAIAIPVGLLALLWLVTLRQGTTRFRPALMFAHGFLALVGLAATAAAVAGLAGIEGPDATAFRNAQVTVVVLGAPLLGVAAALHHWAPKLWGRSLPSGLAMLQFLLLFGGVLATAVPGYVVGLGGDDSVAVLGAAGSLLCGLGVALFAAAPAGRRPTGALADHSGGGLTLEWATTSPPPPHNFDELPQVRSAYPLAEDVEAASGRPA